MTQNTELTGEYIIKRQSNVNDDIKRGLIRSEIQRHQDEAILDAEAGMFHSAIFELRECIRLTGDMWLGE